VEPESPSAPRRGRAFVPRRQVLGPDEVAKALRRMAHEVVERVADPSRLVVVGVQVGGAELAVVLADIIGQIAGVEVPRGTLDVSLYRDDVARRPLADLIASSIPGELTGRDVLLVDDVLFTGRTVRSALNALVDLGRPRAVQLAVLVDRGHRELPIRADYVGKNLPTALEEAVRATLEGVWLGVES
jgi:pyrimidine operon attenuation protein/uracil phosphoribosyltransferase